MAAPATPTAEPEPTPERVHVTATSLSVVLSDGSVGADFDYSTPVSGAIDGLTEAFGSDPAVTEHPGGYSHAPYTTFDWDGFVLLDADGAGEEPFYSDWSVAVTASDVGDVAIHTVEGIRIGDSAPELEAAFPDSATRSECCDTPERTDFRLGAEPVGATEEEVATLTGGAQLDGPLEFAVWLMAADPAGPVTDFRAPSLNFGD